MALDIATATAKSSPPAPSAADEEAAQVTVETSAARRRRGRFSSLTRRILLVNVLALAVLGVGLLQLGDYQRSLVETQIGALKVQAQVFAAAIGEGAVSESAGPGDTETLIPDLGRQMVRRLVEPTRNRARLFDIDGKLVVDTRVLQAMGGVQISELPPPEDSGFFSRVGRALNDVFQRVLPGSYPNEDNLPLDSPGNYPEVKLALDGDIADAVRRRANGGLVLSVAAPVQHYRQVLGALLLTSDSGEIEQAVRGVRFTIVEAFAVALAVTFLLSIYLAGTIARPIRRLAAAAERIRQGHGREVAIPNLQGRGDEIGELADSLRHMTAALWQRMDAIERFAADVAHEIKNPLTSVRSAIETATRVEPEKRDKLLALVLEDIERLTRLINDISDSSRLDAEMSRTSKGKVLVARILAALVEVHQASAGDKKGPKLELSLPGPRGTASGDLPVFGDSDRLVQVFRNIIANAQSFSPPDGTIRIAALQRSGYVVVTVDDDGPGIPESKLDAIFERFYSERPAGEKFGTHSGLGLSISKQIVESHGGTIRAENRTDRSGNVVGARFIVRLPVV